MATYNPNVPQSTDNPSVSQGQILTNFQELNTIFAINHIEFDNATAANRGKHSYISMIAQAAPVTGAGEGALYAFNTGVAREQVYWRRESNGVSVPLSTLGGHASVVGSSGALQTGTYNLTSARTAEGRYTMSFTNAMLNNTYSVVATADSIAGTVRIMTIITKNTTDFTLECKGLDNSYHDPDTFSVIVMGEIA